MYTVYKKGMSIILVILMVMGGMSGVITPSGGTAYAADGFALGTGTIGDPYQIATSAELNEVRNHLGAGLYFKLTADIDLSGYANWEPIGEIFYGNMDGNGYKITHLRINRENSDGVGLFGNFGPNNKITNMRLEDVVVRGRLYSGGLVGMNSGTISNSYATGTVNGNIYAGGLVGANSINGIITNNSYATGSVNGKEYVGGVAGFNRGIISNSYATGSVNGDRNVGGLVGGNKKTISNSYATGSVIATSTTSSIVGGLVGENSIGTISNSYATGNVSGHFVVGGLVGYNFDGGVISTSYTTGNASGGRYVGGLVGLEDAILNSVHTSIGSIAGIEAIAGVTAPVTGATPVTAITAFSVYTATVSWSLTDSVFAGGTAYTATIKITPKPGYVLSGIPANFFKVAGATTTNEAGSGVVVALFPATQVVSITTVAIAGVTAPVTGDTPVSMISDTTAYTATVSWSPTTTSFSGETAYRATITITPKAWYTLTGVPEDFFTVAGATTTNAANSGIVTAEFPPTAAIITSESIAGVTAPVTGAIPVTTSTASSSYTATVSWSPTTTAYAGETAYTATISMTPKAGYTLTGVPANFFKVAGATSTNAANSGVVTATFLPTAATIATKAITGVIVPVTGETPVSTISDTTAYTATLTWLPTATPFGGATAYTAMIVITPKAGYTLTGVPVDFFTVAGATTTNAANSGIVTAVFPATAATIATAEITGVVAPVAGATPVATIADTAAYTASYTASVTWLPTTTPFGGEISYTATIVITPKSGYTLTGVPVDFFTVAGATTTNAANSGVITAVFPATAAVAIATGAIVGVTAPVTGETPVATIADTAEYTATIAWTPVDAIFAGAETYTATITLTPKTGYTLTDVDPDFFTVAGAITTNAADSGVVTAVFPATVAVPISIGAIAGVTAPVTGVTPVTTVTYSSEYTATITWSPTTTLFVGETAYTATITIIPKGGYTLMGVSVNFFSVVGATTTNDADSGIVTAIFPATVAIPVTEVPVTTVPIATAGIVGVPAPVTGATPVTTVTYSAEYSATVSWSPTTTLFVGGTAYTATITITPKAGYTLTGVPDNFFNVAGATTTNAAHSGVVTAVFPATQPVSTGTDAGSGNGSTFTAPSDSIVTSTNGKLTLPVNKTGEVSLEDEVKVKVSIPIGATDKELKLTIEKVLDTQKLLSNKEILLSPVFEIMKNFPENFSKPVTLTFTLDLKSLKSNQKPAVFYYDEVKKAWVEVAGGKIEENHIMVEVNHFGKYAVLIADEATGLTVREQSTDTSTKINVSDIAGHWAEDSIKQAVSNGMVKGYLDGMFKPNHTVTRAEFAVMLMNVLKPQGEGEKLTFTDTANIGAWAQQAVAQAIQAGIIKGYEDSSFRPNAEITRAEMAVILAKALGKSTEVKLTTSFADDKDIPAWAKGSVDFVKQAGMVQGKGNNEFAPQDHATRAEAVTVLLNLWAQKSN